ncbi:MAG: HEPN domain-containing protein [Actinomycetota bacterium]|nr:HEPN domain-containing protein [Actinomycetota bacterium]
MSPRSEELMRAALEQLEAARTTLAAGLGAPAVSDAYYSMLYAARAALSEEDRNARTHRGTWSLFRELFVEGGSLDASLASDAERVRELREAADYDAATVSRDEAAAAVEQAERFIDVVRSLLER